MRDLNLTIENVLNLTDMGEIATMSIKFLEYGNLSDSFSFKYGLCSSGQPTGIRDLAHYEEIDPNCLGEPILPKIGMYH